MGPLDRPHHPPRLYVYMELMATEVMPREQGVRRNPPPAPDCITRGFRFLRDLRLSAAGSTPYFTPDLSTNPSRFGIFTCGRVLAFISALSGMIPFRNSMYAVTA